MNKQETKEFEKLRWECFLERKVKEIAVFLFGLIMPTFGLIYLGKLILFLNILPQSYLVESGFFPFTPFNMWSLGFCCVVFLTVISGGIYGSFYLLKSWLLSNWKKATKDAKNKMKHTHNLKGRVS